jgi:GNAT superfamily N-acetyltransferase
MYLKLAEEKDREDFIRMCKNFFDVSPFSSMTFSRVQLDGVFDVALNNRLNAIVILLVEGEDNVGMVVGHCSSPLFAEEAIASELAWWVDEEHRNSRKASELIAAYEDWAIRVGAHSSTLAYIEEVSPPSVSRYYERLGYTKTETSYLKEFNNGRY